MPSDHPKKTSTPVLVKLAHASAPFLSTFLLIHLSTPLLANVGGSNLSSNVMVRARIIIVLGREYTNYDGTDFWRVALGEGVLPNLVR